MKLVSIPAYISKVPLEPIDLKNSIILIEEGNNEYLIGEAAMSVAPDSTRRFGGTLSRPEYRRLLKALVAATLGEGDHVIASSALAAAIPYVEEIRSGPGKTEFAPEQEQLLRDALSEIKFRSNKSDEKIKICRVTLVEPPRIYHELQGVHFALPSQLRSYVTWQLGHGDWQQAVFVDGNPMRDGFQRAEGIAGAVRRLASIRGLSPAEADKAWRTGRMPAPGQMGGMTVSCDEDKRKALKQHINAVIGKLLNAVEPWRERVNNIVLSGGAAKDSSVYEILAEEVEADGIYKLHRIDNLPIKDERCEDPSMTCVRGMLSHHALALDVGNSFLKAGYLG